MRIVSLVPKHPRGALEFVVVRERTGRSRKLRTLAKPSPALKELHWALKERLEQLAYLRHSPLDNAFRHVASRYFYQLDLADAFPSTSVTKVAARLFVLDHSLGDIKEIEGFLTRYCFVPGLGLAQGAPTSPLLFDLVAEFWLDEPIARLLAELEARGFPRVIYTRYVDDLTFSSDKPIGEHVRYKLREVIRKAGYRVSATKSSVLDRTQQPPVVTGVRLMPGLAPTLTPEFYAHFERELDELLRLEHRPREAQCRSIEGSLQWFFSLEQRVAGAKRNRRVRRITTKARAAKRLLVQTKPPARAREIYPKAWLARLREQLPIVAYVRSKLPYQWAPKATGIKCRCPFASCGERGKKGELFSVSDNKRSFYCRACKAHGDVVEFAMRFHRLEFPAAVTMLAAEAGLQLPEAKPASHRYVHQPELP